MKTLITLIFLSGAFAQGALAEERTLPIDTQLPKLGKEWIRRNDDGAKDDYSWVNFDHKHSIGEVLSFVAGKVSTEARVTDGSIAQASLETFSSNGSARFSKSKRGQPIGDTVRHHVVSINIRTADMKHEFDVIEYTYVYESDRDSVATMAHGYCLVAGETVLFVQHTSPNIINSELAFDMAAEFLSSTLRLSGKPRSYGKGKAKLPASP